MKRDILLQNRHVTTCCPGHDTFPGDTYKCRLSRKARAKSKQLEHQNARAGFKRSLQTELQQQEASK